MSKVILERGPTFPNGTCGQSGAGVPAGRQALSQLRGLPSGWGRPAPLSPAAQPVAGVCVPVSEAGAPGLPSAWILYSRFE